MKEEDAVYDVVDEKEYAERVKGRVEEGFIVDDDGEYVEDGRYGEHVGIGQAIQIGIAIA